MCQDREEGAGLLPALYGGLERGQWVSCGGMKIARASPGTRVEKQKLSSGRGGGRHSQGTSEPEQINAPVPCGTAQVVVEKGAWWPGAFQQGGLCAEHCREAGKTFWELTSQSLTNLMSKPGSWVRVAMFCWNTGATLSSRGVQAQR